MFLSTFYPEIDNWNLEAKYSCLESLRDVSKISCFILSLVFQLVAHQRCVQLRRLPARRLCRRPHGMAPVAGECPRRCKYECYILIHIGLKLIPSNKIWTI